MKRVLYILLLVLMGGYGFAIGEPLQDGLLDDIVGGKYKAESLDVDSVLRPAGRYTLTCTDKRMLYRRSFEGIYELRDSVRHETQVLGNGEYIRSPKQSPNGKYILYTKGNELYIYKVDFKVEVPLTKDSEAWKLNGVCPWIYDEEFTTAALYDFAPDSKSVAFVRFDMRGVKAYPWILYGDSVRTDSVLYGNAGEQIPQATVCMYDIHYKSITPLGTGDMKDVYVPRLMWRSIPKTTKLEKNEDPNDYYLMISLLNRDQNDLSVLSCNKSSLVCRPWYKEHSDSAWVDYQVLDEWQWFADGTGMIVSGDVSKPKSVSLYDVSGHATQTLLGFAGSEPLQGTPIQASVQKVYGFDTKSQTLYYLRDDRGYKYNVKKNVTTPLNTAVGTYSYTFSKDLSSYVERFENTTTPPRYTYKGKVLLSNDSVRVRWEALGLPEKEFFELTGLCKGWILKGTGPTVVQVYGGPQVRDVRDTWKKGWEYALVQQGYTVLTLDMDVRATEHYLHAGDMVVQKLIASIPQIAARYSCVDPQRICLWGWSFGGYTTLRTMCTDGCPFKCGIAVAPVTDWRMYDAPYTERFMRRPQVNGNGYDGSSLLPLASNLQGRVLIVHGLADDNVHIVNTWSFVEALVQAGKQFEMQVYPDDDHFLRKRSNSLHLYNRFIDFLNKTL